MNKDLIQTLKFLHETERLKSTLRKYPLSNGRKESSAEHSWRLSLMSFMIADQLKIDIDIRKATEIAIVHDLAEVYAGDFDTFAIHTGKMKRKVKEDAEKKAMLRLIKHLPKQLGRKIHKLWNEYESEKTPEARYIKALDKIESTLQYIETNPKLREGHEFVASVYADSKVRNFEKLRPLLDVVKKELKKEYKKTFIPWKKSYSTTGTK